MSRFDQEQAMREACAKDPYPTKAYVGAGNQASDGGLNPQYGNGPGIHHPIDQCGPSCGGSMPYRPNIRTLIDERINYHNKQANDLCALQRALPGEMSMDAEDALVSLLIESRY